MGVLRHLLVRPGNPVAYLSAQVRNPTSLRAFHEELSQQDLTWQLVDEADAANVRFNALVCREDVSDIIILQIAAACTEGGA